MGRPRGAQCDFAAKVDVITYEFENVPVACAEFLAPLKPLRPGIEALRIAQHREREKRFFERIGVPTAPFAVAQDEAGFVAAVRAKWARPRSPRRRPKAMTARARRGSTRRAISRSIWAKLGRREVIVEGFVDFAAEASVIVARALDGSTLCFPPPRNVHRDGILHTSTIPGGFSPDIVRQAEDIGRRAIEALGGVGLLCVELFVTRDGRVLANEMAPQAA